jgi:hypothetical protein
MPTFRGGPIAYKATSELTIATGAVTVLGNVHTVDTESDAASDDLSTITAGDNVLAGHLLIISAANAGRDVVVKDGTGNINLPGGDYTIDDADKRLTLIYDGTNWEEISRGSLLTTRGDTLVATSGVVAGTRLPLGAAGAVLTSDGSDAAWAAVASSPVVGYTATTASVSNTTSKTAVVTVGAIGANDWDDGDILTISIAALTGNSSGANRTATWEVSVEGNTASHVKTWENTAAVGYMFWYITLMRAGSEIWWGFANEQVRLAGMNAADGGAAMMRIASVDFTAAVNVLFNLTFSVASANLYLTAQSANAWLTKRAT